MHDIINPIKPYKIKSINTIEKSFIFYKELLRTISKKGSLEFSSEQIYPLRWSNKKESFVIDFRTLKVRDISGICLDSIDDYYSNDSSVYYDIKTLLSIFNKFKHDSLWEDLHLKKSEIRFIPIMKSSGKFLIIGVYSFCNYKSREGSFTNKNNKSNLLDNSIETQKKICKLLSSNDIINSEYYTVENYSLLFREFKKNLLEKNYKFNINKEVVNINLKEYIYKEFNYNITLKEFRLLINSMELQKKDDIEKILHYLIYIEFFNFIKSILGFKESIIVYDKLLQKNIKIEDITKTRYTKVKEEIQSNQIVFLPKAY